MSLHFIQCVIFAVALLAAPWASAQNAKAEMLLYCGITMVRPMTEIAQIFEKRENVKVTISQGGSDDLYQAAKRSGIGDFYLPGEPTYRALYLKEGLLGDFVTVGYNQMALMVQKGNPKKVKADPHEMLRPDLTMILGNATSGSVGMNSKEILDNLGIYPKAIKVAAFLSPDSRSLANAMKKNEADLTMNWRAVGFFTDNAALLDTIDLDPRIAKPQALQLTLLKSSKNQVQARRFMDLASGEEGQAIFRKYGFLDNKTSVQR
ncbi:MAG: substrate-binding domain-containing protein [Burkholderiaceae bacterium]|nr:substrate-binding domain-containing protein [Burkholderiaceae bacterium]